MPAGKRGRAMSIAMNRKDIFERRVIAKKLLTMPEP